MQHHLVVVQHLGEKLAREFVELQPLDLALELDVVGQVQLHLGDDADAAITANGGIEQGGIGLARGFVDLAVGKHDAQGAHAADDRPLLVEAPVGIDAERSADGEVVEILHHPHGEVVGIDVLLNIPPGGSALHADALVLRVQLENAVEGTHVEMQAGGIGALAAHAVAAAADGYGAVGGEYGVDDVLLALRSHHLADANRIQGGDVVDDQRVVPAFGNEGGLVIEPGRNGAKSQRDGQQQFEKDGEYCLQNPHVLLFSMSAAAQAPRLIVIDAIFSL